MIPIRYPFLLSGADRNFHPYVHIRTKYHFNFVTLLAILEPCSTISLTLQRGLQLLQRARRFVRSYIGPITTLLSTLVDFTALLQPTAIFFPINLDSRMLLHCVRRQPIISSSPQGLVALFWTPPADPLITLNCLYMLCGGWLYFLLCIQLGIENPLTSLELHAVPQPHTTAAISHPMGLHILPAPCAISVTLLL